MRVRQLANPVRKENVKLTFRARQESVSRDLEAFKIAAVALHSDSGLAGTARLAFDERLGLSMSIVV